MDIKEIFQKPLTKLTIAPALVYGVAYAGRSYLKINPVHAALFSLGTFVAAEYGAFLARTLTGKNYPETHTGLAIRFISTYCGPSAYAIRYGIFSPLQAITAIGLTTIAANIYGISKSSPFKL